MGPRGCPVEKEGMRAEAPEGLVRIPLSSPSLLPSVLPLLHPSSSPLPSPPFPGPSRPPREGQRCRLKLQEVEDRKI